MSTKPRILLVDDDRMLRLLGERALTNEGFFVQTVETGEKALELFQNEKPDVILLDVVLPALDGFSVCAKIRELPEGKTVPILMMTGLNDLQSIEKAYQRGATDFVTKPINWLILCRRLEYIFRGSQAMIQLYQTMSTLKQSEDRLSQAQKLARLGHWDYCAHSRKIIYSDTISDIFEESEDENTISVDDLWKFIHPDDRSMVLDALDQALTKSDKTTLECRIITKKGNTRSIVVEMNIFQNKDRPLIHGILQDVSERRAAENKIRKLVYYDSNTEFHNHHYFTENAAPILKSIMVQAKTGAVLNVGFSNLAKIAQYLGAERLNKFYRTLGENLRGVLHQLPSASTSENLKELNPCVIGEGIFAILLTNLNSVADLIKDIETILREVSKKIMVDGQELWPSIRIGVSLFPDDGDNIHTLMNNADVALNQMSGFGQYYQFYSRVKHEQTAQHVTIENRLNAAIQQELLIAHYQPKFSLQENIFTGSELLCRWHDQEFGTMPPDQFIQIAEESGLIVPLGEWVIRTACIQANQWIKQGLKPFTIAVNLSAQNFWDKDLVGVIEKNLYQQGITGEYLEFEITERTLLHDFDHAISTMNAICEFGSKFSIDDFGTGYSSLGYLMRLPIQTVKIDKSFISNIDSNQDSYSITNAIIGLAKNLNLKVIAEGVESQQQIDILKTLGCDEVQGFIISKALPPDELLRICQHKTLNQLN